MHFLGFLKLFIKVLGLECYFVSDDYCFRHIDAYFFLLNKADMCD